MFKTFTAIWNTIYNLVHGVEVASEVFVETMELAQDAVAIASTEAKKAIDKTVADLAQQEAKELADLEAPKSSEPVKPALAPEPVSK